MPRGRHLQAVPANVQPGLWLAASAILGRPVRGSDPYPCLCGYRRGKTGGWSRTYLRCATSGEHTCPCYGRRRAVDAACCGGRR